MEYLDHEEMRLLLLDAKYYVTGNVLLYQGTQDQALVYVAEILRPAIARKMSDFILVHNHPSGDPTPSPTDIQTTSSVVEAAKIMNMNCLDHIIIGHNQRFVSLHEQMNWV